jgi:hypothetical protein
MEEEEVLSINIPKKEKYTLCILDSKGNPKNFIVFGASSQVMDEEEIKISLFSNDEERKILDTIEPQPTFHYSSQQIHIDDSIRTIKKKIIHELGSNNVCYEEIYLFSNIQKKIKILNAYQEITQQSFNKPISRIEKELQEIENIYNEMNKKTLGQFLLNLKVSNDIVEQLENLESNVVTYEDILKFLPKEDEFIISTPIGQKFSKKFNFLFSGNPMDILSSDGELLYKSNKNNEIYVFENHLLLNYGKLDKNIIYVCLAEDVLNYAITNNIDSNFIIKNYYPLLFKKNIISLDLFNENRQNLILQNQTLIKPSTINEFDKINTFYDIYYSRKNELSYIDRGINSFDIIIHPDYDIPLPLDVIFKQVHSTKEMPFIKYNPGLRRENIYRLYSETFAKNGKKIPYLKKNQILNISRQTGKMREISFYIQQNTKKQVVELFIDFQYNGNIRVRSTLSKSISSNDLETIIYNTLNPIIISVNDFLEKSGYNIAFFEILTDNNIEILNIEYGCKINLNKPMKLTNYLGCLTSIFDIPNFNFDFNKIVNLQFIRVENYTKMNAIAIMITDLFRESKKQEEIISSLMVNFNINHDEALKEILKYFNDHTRIQGQYVNKTIEIIDNPGFPVSMNKNPFDDKLIIKVNKITSIYFIEVLHIYIDTILRLTQNIDSIEPELIKKINNLCNNKTKTVEENAVENIIATNVILSNPIEFNKEEEFNDDDNEKYLPDDYDEDEEYFEEDEGEGQEREPVIESQEREPIIESQEREPIIESQEREPIIEGQEREPIIEGQEREPIIEGQEREPDIEGQEREPIIEGQESKDNSLKSEESNRFLPSSNEESKDNSLKSEESNRFLPSSNEESKDNSLKSNKKIGGVRTKSTNKAETESKKEKSNIFTKRIKDREPTLILTKKQGKFSSYSRICPANVSLQPVILTNEEKNKIDEEHPGSYTNAIQYGTDPKNPYWYICPRYWCLKNNTPMTEEEVKRGECGGKIIPDNAKAPPPGHFIYEFTDDKYHKNEKGEYIYHSPGFKPEHSHPDKLCLPCCYNKWSSYNMKNQSEQQKRRQQCGLVDHYVYTDEIDETTGERKKKIGPDGKPIQYSTIKTDEDLIEDVKKNPNKNKEEEKQKKKINVFGIDRIPIPQYRWGFLPPSVELFLHTDNNKYTVRNNPALIQPHKRPLLRYGIENSQNKSFIGVLADIYSYSVNIPLPTIPEMCEIIANSINLDSYLKFHNGSLVSIFKPSRIRIDDLTVEKYKTTEFYQSIDLNNIAQYNFLKDTISSFHNFLSYLQNKDSIIDHTYLWDIISSKESPIFEGGINLVILRIFDNDFTENVELICPTSSYSSNIYIKERGTILLLLHNDYYEPIYLYEDKDKENPLPPIKIFDKNTSTIELKQLQIIFENILETTNKYCKPIPNRPRIYEYKENITSEELLNILLEFDFFIKSQVLNYNGKIIGLIVYIRENDKKSIFLPCFPSSILPNISKIYIDFVEWNDYIYTRDTLIQVSIRSQNKILSKPLFKIIEDGLIVGILTETNQIIFINPPTENIIQDDILSINTFGYKEKEYFKKDIEIMTNKNFDEKRINTINNISLETQFYTSFRSILRNLLNDYLFREYRKNIIEILDDAHFLYTVKIKKIETLIRNLMKNSVNFIDNIDNDVKKKILQSTDTSNDIKSYCLMEKNKICIPKKNLISGINNENLYYSRLADELIRYKRIQIFLLQPTKYLNITNIEFQINKNEILILDSVLTDAYFDSLELYNNSKFVKNITYDNATISKINPFYQYYSNNKE